MRRFGPRDVVLYVLLGLMIFFTFSALQHMERNDALTYSQIRTLFLRERVEYFTLEGKTLTLSLRGQNGGEAVRLTYQVANPAMFQEDMREIINEQLSTGVLKGYDYPPGVEGSWWYNLVPYLVAAVVLVLAGLSDGTSIGTGVIFSEDGIVVTNDHVVDGASTITVRTKDGESYEATLLGTDSKTDIAVLRIEADGLTPAILGDSDALSVGEYAMAIGNPLGQLGGTVTDGIVSALSREVNVNGENMTLLQTNAAINPGNSGGGLFNEKGELIGIVNAKSSNGASSSGASIEGLGFAIPVNTVKNSVQELLDYGYVRGRPALGITLLNVQNAQDAFQYRVSRLGVYVQSVTEGGASEKAGVQVGDCIIALGDVAVSTHAEVKSQLNNYAVGDTVQLQVIRDGRTLTLDVTLEEFKPDAES